MTAYGVVVESDREYGALAHVLELPGCVVYAESADHALTLISEGIRQHLAWRASHGLPSARIHGAQPVLVEEVAGTHPWVPNGVGALFRSDRQLVSDDEVHQYLRLLACARADLLRAAHAIPRGAYDDHLPGLARTPHTEFLPREGDTARGILLHMAETERWLFSRLGRRIEVQEPDPLRRIVDVRARSIEHLVRYAAEDRDLVFMPTSRQTDDPRELWTVRKLLRRLLEHELEHLVDVQTIAGHWSHGIGQE